MKIGIGVTTYNRPSVYRVCIESIERHLGSVVDNIFVYNDGSSVHLINEYREVYEASSSEIVVRNAFANRGVATGKNWLLRKMMKAENDFLFLCEDDLEVLSPEAVTAYVKAVQRGKIEHLNFAHHGEMNKGGPNGEINSLPTYPHCIGAWSLYTNRVIKQVGYMDEFLVNAWEHVEHTNRIAKAGLTTPFWQFVDVPNSSQYLREQPDAVSQIRSDPNWPMYMQDGISYMRLRGTIPPGM